MKIQIELNEEINKKIAIYKIKNEFKSKKEVVENILNIFDYRTKINKK